MSTPTAESSVKNDGKIKEKSAGLEDSPARLEKGSNRAASSAGLADSPARLEKGSNRAASSAGLADSPARLEDKTARENPDRNAQGQFKPGCKGGPGNPHNRELARIKKLLLSLMSDEEVLQVGRSVLEQAKNGSLAAARIMLQWGNLQKVDPDQVDLEEWQRRQEATSGLEPAPALNSPPDIDVPALAREGQLAATSDWWRTDAGLRNKTRATGDAPVCDAAATAIVAGPEAVGKAVKR